MKSAGHAEPITMLPQQNMATPADAVLLKRASALSGRAGLGAIPLSLSAAPDPSSLFRAFRRRIHQALGLGFMLALLVGGSAWFLVPPAKYTARALILVPSQSPRVLDSVLESQSLAGEDYKRFQKTQISHLMSAPVLNAALKNLAESGPRSDPESPPNPSLERFQTFQGEIDLVEFLQREIQVGFKDGSELLEIALSGEQPEELATIVDAVKTAYMEEIALKDHLKKTARKSQLIAIKEQKEKELKEKRSRAKSLAESVGSDDRATLVIKQQLYIEQISDLERQLAECRALRRKLEAEIDVGNRYPELSIRSQTQPPVSAMSEIETYIEQQGPIAQIRERLDRVQDELQRQESRVQTVSRNPDNDPVLKGLRKQAVQLEAELARKRLELQPLAQNRLARQQARVHGSTLEQLQFSLETARVLEAQLLADRERLSGDSQKLNVETIDLQSMHEEITQTKEKFLQVSAEVEKLGIEIQAPERIQVVENARVPRARDELKRFVLVGTATMGAFFGGLGLVTFMEFKNRKLTSAEEVVQGLGIQIVGSLPPLPSRSRGLAAREIGEDTNWYRMMLESIDSTRAMILHEARAGNLRVLMVTSAISGEGKTSLSCHLATSLARAGFTTLLIDADFRNPSVAKVFDVCSTTGLGEVLCNEATLDEVLVPSNLPELTIMPAGRYSDVVFRGLSQGSLRKIFSELKDRFEFVIVDSAPVLPVADALTIATYVDAVILSTLRDVSRLPKVFAAYQRLGVLGVRILGAVVTGVHGGLYANDQGSTYPYPGRGRG